MRLLIVLALAAMLSGQSASPADASDVTMYECVAQNRLAGREEPKPDAAQSRISGTGEPRYLASGETGYAGVETGKPLPEWLELYGALQGHASSFLGFYLAKDFKCGKAEG